MLLVLPFFWKSTQLFVCNRRFTPSVNQTTIAADPENTFFCNVNVTVTTWRVWSETKVIYINLKKISRREGSDKTTKSYPASGQAQQPAVAAAGSQQRQQQQPAGLLQQRPEQSGRLAAGVWGDGQVCRRSVFVEFTRNVFPNFSHARLWLLFSFHFFQSLHGANPTSLSWAGCYRAWRFCRGRSQLQISLKCR